MLYDDTYDVLEDGSVINIKTGKTLKPQMRGPYQIITLHAITHPNHYGGLLHRLIGRVWLPNPLNLPQIDHIDRNKLNNNVSNLRWVTRSENLLNRAPYTEPRSDNTSGHLHIQLKARDKGDGFMVRLVKWKHYSTHDTLEEALATRDRIMATPIPSAV